MRRVELCKTCPMCEFCDGDYFHAPVIYSVPSIHCAGKYIMHVSIFAPPKFWVLLHSPTFSLQSQSSRSIKMDFTPLNPESDLQCLEEIERLCKELSNKYDAAARWIQQKECIDNPDGKGCAWSTTHSRWYNCGRRLACKTTGEKCAHPTCYEIQHPVMVPWPLYKITLFSSTYQCCDN